ncbi:MAG: carboxyl transferase domain-containing protein [Wenzhouxiangellaceae bacterium]|nr:carboxyl transferase domain-containing protein [Wenzhouxiangellaceae bacterium]
MSTIDSVIDTRSKGFAANRERMLAQIAEVDAIRDSIRQREEAAREKFEKRGQLLPRERLGLLLDSDSAFVEICDLAGYRMYDDRDGSTAGGGSIAGIGKVNGVRVVVTASNSAIKGGTISPIGLQKGLRLQKIALENRLPMISLLESGGANLNYQSELFVEGARSFANQARLSAAGIPQITVVHGNATAGGAYVPGLSDYVVMVRDRARVYLAGPPLVKAATGEDADDESLGGAAMHASTTGTAEWIAEDDADGVRRARELAGLLAPMFGKPEARREFEPPRFDIDELLGIVPAEPRHGYDVREVIARLVDASEFVEFKAEYDTQTICGFAAIEGQACAVIGNNGPITANGATKATQFIQLCCQAGRPLIYLQNTTGYMVGTDAEHNGIVKHGSKMIQAVANAGVPQMTVLLGGSFGAGNYGMCGRGLDPRFIFAWPNARIGVMGGEQAAKVMAIITEQKHARADQQVDPAMLEMLTSQIRDKIESESTALFATARLWDDGIIDPRDTRRMLALSLEICAQAGEQRLNPNSYGVGRF